jgi:serine/threonine-protein kinase
MSDTLAVDTVDTLVERALRTLPLADRVLLQETIGANGRASIRASGGPETADRALLELLADQAASHNVVSGIDFGETLGEGGMGLVRLATQRSLGREVAVKTLKPEARSPEAVARLLREARVTGALEHPNIVPVYDLGFGEDGAPLIVLKRIRGDAWSSLLLDANAVRARFGGADLLEHNLRVLVQVCHAVSLAHARGVLHLDLKPDNVMIGSFGEVYLVDWGIAVASRDDAPLPPQVLARRRGLTGTPAYMAPEMIAWDTPLSEQTDVYLLGAILFEILAGSPPHDHGNLRAIFVSVLGSDPHLPPGAPDELASIVRTAMRRNPDERFASVDELRQRIEWYLRHRGSLALSDAALRRLVDLRALATADAGAPRPGDREGLYRLFAEARFGFRQALEASVDNTAAREGLREVIAVVTTWELDHGTARAASAALAELPKPPEDLASRVATALEAEVARDARLAALERGLDPAAGRRLRALTGILLGAVWSAFPVGLWLLDRPSAGAWAHHTYLVTIALSLVTAAATYLMGLRSAFTSGGANGRAVVVLRISLAGQLALEVASALIGLPVRISMVLHFGVWFPIASAYAQFVDPRIWPTAAIMVIALLVSAANPDWVWGVSAAAVVVMMLNPAVAPWVDRFAARRPPPRDPA